MNKSEEFLKSNKMSMVNGFLFPSDQKDWSISDHLTYNLIASRSSDQDEKENTCENQQNQTALNEMELRNSLAQDSRRNAIFQEHRQYYKSIMEASHLKLKTISEPADKSQSETNMSRLKDLKPLYLSGLDFTYERFVKGHKLTLTIMDYATIGPTRTSATAFVVQDDMGYIERMVVYNFKEVEKKEIRSGRMLEVGSRLILIEPYVKIASDGKSTIRIDDPKKIVHLNEKIKDMCRFCGKKDAKFRCAKCDKAKYCCKECQSDDWKILSHKLICA